MNITVNEELAKKIVTFLQAFVNKNDEHTAFFGGNLLGVHKITWGDEYEGRSWLEEICGVEDIDQLQDDLYDIKDINPSHVTSSSLTNLSFLYMSHLLYASNLKEETKHNAIVATIMLAHCKHLTSLMGRRFRHAANPATARAMYEGLKYDSSLKKHGSWLALIRNRGEQVLADKFIWKRDLEKFDNDKRVTKWANDLQTRIRNLVNVLTRNFYDVHKEANRINTYNHLNDIGGELELSAFKSQQANLQREMMSFYTRKNDLMKEQLIDMTTAVITTSDKRLLEETLGFMVENNRPLHKDLVQLTETLVIFMYSVARENNIPMKDISKLVAKYVDMFRGSGTRREDILTIKNIIKQITDQAVPRARRSMQTSTRVALFTYLVIRIFSIK